MPSYFSLILLGAAIGTGLLYQSGKVLYYAGPAPACLAYLLMGSVTYSVLVPLSSSVISAYSNRFPMARWFHFSLSPEDFLH
jgi:amino acid permease